MIPASGFSNRFFNRIANDINIGKIYFDSIAKLGSQTAGRLDVLVVNEGTYLMNNIAVALNISGCEQLVNCKAGYFAKSYLNPGLFF